MSKNKKSNQEELINALQKENSLLNEELEQMTFLKKEIEQVYSQERAENTSLHNRIVNLESEVVNLLWVKEEMKSLPKWIKWLYRINEK